MIIGDFVCKLRSNLCLLFWTTVSAFNLLLVPVSAIPLTKSICFMTNNDTPTFLYPLF